MNINLSDLENSDKLVNYIIEGILEKKGRDVIRINFEGQDFGPCEDFIICHGDTGIQSRALADSVEKKVKENLDIRVWHREGTEIAQWILLDYGPVVVHIFQKDARDYYKLEDLWADAEVALIHEEINR